MGLLLNRYYQKLKLGKFTVKSVLLTTRFQNPLLPNYPTLTYALQIIYIYQIPMLEVAFSTLPSDTPCWPLEIGHRRNIYIARI